MSGNFLSCSKDPFEFPEFRCDEPPDASEEMGLISPGGENLLDFLELGRVSRVKTGTSGTRSGGLRKGQCPWELQGGLSGFLSRRCWGLRPCVESGPEPEDSSPVLTWVLAYFWSLPWGDSRSTPRSMSALERNPQVPASTPHKVLGPGIDGRGIPKGSLATPMGTGLS